jgi:hypothetical protein
MTEKQQHCDHESVCTRFIGSLAWKDSTRCMANQDGCKECIHDSRIKPTQLPLTPVLQDYYAARAKETGKALSTLVLADLTALWKKRVARDEKRVWKDNEYERL